MISNEIALAYTQCKLKAYLLMFTDRKGIQNEYISVLKKETIKNREEYFDLIEKQTSKFKYYSPDIVFPIMIPTLSPTTFSLFV